ncbi:hypothetical protein C7U60_02375 [Mesorhizobium plurifarium]|uniref:nucleotide-binding protein n=1 Tax=Sinorhizobium arboris TaxID=76745 RepID=UPI000482432A|nr:Wzz/FepE/Etk N-terminal domain-containing protein [Sinorhizobium arboris]PST27153.1 hypothetical protein C7U60_02375 [Mesorhizobium plurifarium]
MRYEHYQAARWQKISALSPDVPRPLLLGSILSFLSANRLKLALWGIVGLALAAAYVSFAAPVYQARAVVILDYRTPVTGGQQVLSDSADSAYIDTQIMIIETDDVLREVIEELHLDQDPEFVAATSGLSARLAAWRQRLERLFLAAHPSPQEPGLDRWEAMSANERQQIAAKQLRKIMRVNRAARSYVAEIEVQASSSEKSARITNAIARTYVEHQAQFRLQATERESVPLARIVTPASPFVEPAGLKTPVLLVLGLVGGLGLGTCVIAAGAAMRCTVAGRRDLEDELGVRCLGLVPNVRALQRNLFSRLLPRWLRGRRTSQKPLPGTMSYAANAPSSLFCESLRLLRAQMAAVSNGERAIVVGVVSPSGTEGRSTLIANFAELLTRAGDRVLLVDADFSNRRLSRALAPLGAPLGEGDAGAEVSSLPATTLRFAALHGRNAEYDFMNRQAWIEQIVATNRDAFEWICVDMPALARCGDALAMIDALDHVVIVAEWNRTEMSVLGLALKMLEPVRSKVLGVVLNKVGRRKMTLME